MSDLISRKALMKDISESYIFDGEFKNIFVEMIDNQPTAYDVPKVVEELEKKMFTADLYEHGWDGQTVDNLLCYGDVYEIVKGGLEE
jgi:hypothetical protein